MEVKSTNGDTHLGGDDIAQGDLVVILAIGITGAPGVARLARSLAMDIKTRDYIRAAAQQTYRMSCKRIQAGDPLDGIGKRDNPSRTIRHYS